MFFFFSIMPKIEEIGIVDSCHIYKQYMVFYLFFVPVFKWGKKYFAKRYYEDTMYELDLETGKKIEDGIVVNLSLPERNLSAYNICSQCGRQFDKEYSFCPYCGKRL